jgi:hypothetical protein
MQDVYWDGSWTVAWKRSGHDLTHYLDQDEAVRAGRAGVRVRKFLQNDDI